MNLLSWNTQWCCGNDGVVSPARIVDTARALGDFDVLCLQEIAVNYPRLAGGAGHDQPALLRDLLPGFTLFFGAAVDEFQQEGRRQFGNLVATRLPVLQVQHHPLPYPADAGVRSMPRMCTVVTVLDPQLGPVRVMTTHLEFYSRRQRMAQVIALGDLHQEYCLHTEALPQPSDDGSPFDTRTHTRAAVLCGDFNFEPREAEYAVLTATQPMGQWWDSWRLLQPTQPHAPTFRLFDRTYGPEPVTSDFVFVSDALKDRVRRLVVDAETQASDHQPVLVEIA
jgi:endonuclease/exonuclease/phosphatase family metal-dependent hydrolase